VTALETDGWDPDEQVPIEVYERDLNTGDGPPPATTSRTPPHSPQAEAAVLGACLLNPQAVTDALEHLGDDDFYLPAHAATWDAIRALHAAGTPIDPLTVADHLQITGHLDQIGGTAALVDLGTNTPSSSNAGHYARIVAERATLRRLIAIGDHIAQLGWTHHTDPGTAVTAARGRIDTVAERLAGPTDRLVDGATFLLDQSPEPPAIWGDGTEVLWAQGESLLLVGPTGVGKTTIAAQILEGLLVGGELLGWTVAPTAGRVLYLAMDRPSQIARALARTLGHHDRDRLNDQLVVWRGPLPHDLGTHPETLHQLCAQVGATTVIIDSLKDAAVKLNTDEVGGNLNRALQMCLAEGVDVVASHHHRKAERGTNKAPSTVDELFGSSLIASGAGSVLQLWGAPGDLVVNLSHLKQPAEQVGPLKILHDHTTGRSEVMRGFDPVVAIRNAPNGLTTIDVARLMFERPTGEVPDNEHRKTARRLESLAAKGLVHGTDAARGSDGRQAPRRWHATTNRQEDP
jgi:replicative DNA helicase